MLPAGAHLGALPAPVVLQGHHWLARQLRQADIAFATLDNSFRSIVGFAQAQALAGAFPIERLHQALDGPAAGVQQVEQVAEPVRRDERSYRGFNLFSAQDLALFVALARGEWAISGFRNAALRRVLPDQSGPHLSRVLKRLHLHGLIKKVGHTYKYYLTDAGRRVVLTALKLRELVVAPSLAAALPAHV